MKYENLLRMLLVCLRYENVICGIFTSKQKSDQIFMHFENWKA